MPLTCAFSVQRPMRMPTVDVSVVHECSYDERGLVPARPGTEVVPVRPSPGRGIKFVNGAQAAVRGHWGWAPADTGAPTAPGTAGPRGGWTRMRPRW